MKTGLFGTIAFTILSASVFAQKGNIKGVILDKTEALPGVSVSIEKNGGTLTDLDGSFNLIGIDTGLQNIHISYIGYANKDTTIRVTEAQTIDLGGIAMTEGKNVIGEVQIVGNFQQGGRAKAINMTKMSDKSITVLSSEGISKSPVKGTANVIRQAPGVAVKDNKVSLRGTSVDWTSCLLNGDWMPTADEKDPSRVFNTEVFPSSLIDYITINRTVTPDIEGDNIGGLINFITKAPVTEKTFNLDLSTGYDALSNKPSYNGSFLWGNISKNKKLSYILNGSYAGENYGKDAPSVAYGTNYNHSLARLQLDRTRGLRQTFGLNTGVDYQASENLKLGAKIVGGRMIEDEYNNRVSYNWSDGSGARIRLQDSRGIYDHMLYGGELNASWKASNRLKVEAKIASYYNRFQFGNTPQVQPGKPNGKYTVEFVSPLLQFTDMTKTDFFGNKYDPNNSKDPNPYYYKLLDVDNPYKNGGDHYNNIQPKYQQLSNNDPITSKDYYLSSVFADLNRTHERDPIVGKLDLDYKVSNKLKIQGGVKLRMKEGERYVSYFEYRLNPETSPKIFLSDQATTAYDPKNNYLKEWKSPYSGTFQPVLTKGQMNTFIPQHASDLVATTMDTGNYTFNQWVGSGYSYKENVVAGYLMAEWKPITTLSITGGVRIESTHLSQSSDSLVTDNSTTIGVNAQTVSIDKNYIAILPSINALYTPDENSNIRASVSRSFHRPNFEQTKPGSPFFERDQFLYIYGNSGLKPTYSNNFDLSYQYFWGTKGMFYIGAYYKNVTDHIFQTNMIDEGQTMAGYTIKGYANANNSFVAGFEALVDRKLDFLPGFWNGFGVSANFTYSYSQMSVPGRSKKQALTEQTPVLYNLALFYEKGKISTRVTLNYTGAFSTELNLFSDPNTHKVVHDNTDYDVFMAKQFALDYQFAWNISKHISGYAIVNNILDAPYRTYIGVPDRPLVTEYYRPKFYLGIKFQL